MPRVSRTLSVVVGYILLHIGSTWTLMAQDSKELALPKRHPCNLYHNMWQYIPAYEPWKRFQSAVDW